MKGVVYVVLGVFLLLGSMRNSERAPNWPSQLGWVVIGFVALSFLWLLAAVDADPTLFDQ